MVRVPNALWTEDVVVEAGCSVEVEVQGSAYSAGAGGAETAVGVFLFGEGEEVPGE